MTNAERARDLGGAHACACPRSVHPRLSQYALLLLHIVLSSRCLPAPTPSPQDSEAPTLHVPLCPRTMQAAHSTTARHNLGEVMERESAEGGRRRKRGRQAGKEDSTCPKSLLRFSLLLKLLKSFFCCPPPNPRLDAPISTSIFLLSTLLPTSPFLDMLCISAVQVIAARGDMRHNPP